MSEKIRKMLTAMADDPRLLERLKSEPEAVAREFNLDSAETARLTRSDFLMVVAHNPLIETVSIMQTTSPITITKHFQFESGDPYPRTLEDLSRERLLELVQRILVEPEYANRVRTFLKL